MSVLKSIRELTSNLQSLCDESLLGPLDRTIALGTELNRHLDAIITQVEGDKSLVRFADILRDASMANAILINSIISANLKEEK